MGAEEENREVNQTSEEPNPNPSRMTPAEFLAWKKQKDASASALKAEADRKRAEDIAAGRVLMNGRELFQHEPWVFDNNQY